MSTMNSDKAFIIGLAGGTASGKTTLSKKIINNMHGEIIHFSFDNFYFGLDENMHPDDYDFDHPMALDFDTAFECLHDLWNKKETKIPVYDFVKHKRKVNVFKTAYPKDIVIIEGILSFHDQRIRELMDLKIFIHCDSDIALCRRLLRDIAERGRDHNEVLMRYNRFVRVDFEEYVKPTMKYADIIIPGGANNDIGFKFILDNLQNMKNKKKSSYSHGDLALLSLLEEQRNMIKIPTSNLYLQFKEMDQTNLLLKGLFNQFNSDYLSQCLDYWMNEGLKRVRDLVETDFGHDWASIRENIYFSGLKDATLPLDQEKKQNYKAHLLYTGLFFEEDFGSDLKNMSSSKMKIINHPKYLICLFTDTKSIHLWLNLTPLFKIIPIFVVDSKTELFNIVEPNNSSEKKVEFIVPEIVKKQLNSKTI